MEPFRWMALTTLLYWPTNLRKIKTNRLTLKMNIAPSTNTFRTRL